MSRTTLAKDTLGFDFGSDKRFYVYLYRDPRPKKIRVPIYVGKGTASQRRADIHWMYRAANPFLSAIFSKIKSVGLSPEIEIVAWFDNENEAFALERALIAKYGRRDNKTGTLANLTDGGEGAAGHIPSAKTRAKMGASISANFHAKLDADPDFAAKLSEQRSAERRASWADPDVAAKYRESSRAASDAKSARMKTLWADPEYQAKHSAKVSAANLAAWADPEKRRKRVEKMRESRKRDAEATSRRSKAMWADPTFKAKRGKTSSARLKALWADPEYRRRQTEAFREAARSRVQPQDVVEQSV